LSSPRITRASVAGSSGGTIRPVTPATTISGRASTSAAMTGLPARMASMAAMPKPSQREGMTSASAWSMKS
jgi:hypothetical protein